MVLTVSLRLPRRTILARWGRWLVPGLLLVTPACRESYSGFGAGARARNDSDQLFGALADRHVEVVRNAKYDYARMQLSRGALSPSHVFDDTAAWTGSSGQVRLLEIFGTHQNDRYVMTSKAGVGAPVKPGDGRHMTTLSRIADGQFQWDNTVDFALGSVRPSDIALVITRLIAAGEGLSEHDARADLFAASPHAAAALGTVFALDTLHPTPLADGTTAVTMVVSVHSEQLRNRFPNFSDYVHKYVDPARVKVLLTDRGNTPYLDAQYKDRVLTVRVRTHGGHLVPLSGPPHPMPDTLVMLADFAVKVKMFTVGFHDLSLDFVNGAKGDEERDWTINARREPHWNLPLISARLIGPSLHHPFAGDGALFKLGVRAAPGDQQTVLVRQSRLGVQESKILNFLNSLTNKAMDDFGAKVEHEENQWLREVFLALRDDARGVLAP